MLQNIDKGTDDYMRDSYLVTGNLSDCCGCHSCESICPKNCIHMEKIDGFFYPAIDRLNCINCGKCISVCQYNQASYKIQSDIDPQVFSCWNKRFDVLRTSTSGGMFSALSDFILTKKGIVYGVEFDNNYRAIMTCAEDTSECDNFKGSKYVRSDTEETYIKVKKQLEEQRMILYVGLPCQIAGLMAFLGKSYVNLLCVDLVCHGTPSSDVFQEYLRYLELKYKSKIVNVNFRYKRDDWINPYIRIVFSNHTIIEEKQSENKYYDIFFLHLPMAPSCYHCPYTKLKRNSDLTIGDFWGIDKKLPQHFNPQGTSLTLINTKKGLECFNNIKDKICFYQTTKENAIASNPQLSKPCGFNPLSASFIPYINRYGFWRAYVKYAIFGKAIVFPYRVVRKAYRIFHKSI